MPKGKGPGKMRRAVKRTTRGYVLKVTNGKVRRTYVGVTTNAGRKAGKARGRPTEYQMPEPIDAPPERVAEVVLQAKPKTVWRYETEAAMKRRKKAQA